MPYKRDSAVVPPEAEIPRESHFGEKPDVSLLVEKEQLNYDTIIDVDTFAEKSFSVTSFIPTKGSVQQREIFFQPLLPKYPEWGEQEFKGGSIIFRIYISADGLVEQVINVQGSGNPEIDAVLARYIERWRFAPVSHKQGQWQTVKIELDK